MKKRSPDNPARRRHHREKATMDGIFSQARAAGLDIDGLGVRMLARKQELMARFEADGLPSPETRTYTGHDLEMSAPVDTTGNA
jgi:hypothetical protein